MEFELTHLKSAVLHLSHNDGVISLELLNPKFIHLE